MYEGRVCPVSVSQGPSGVHEVLLVEDDLTDAQLIRRLLASGDDGQRYRITHVRTLDDALLSADEVNPLVILADLHLPDSKGLDTVERILDSYPTVPLVVISAWQDEATSVRSIKAGAQDYLVKGHISGANLRRVIRYAVERKQTETQVERLVHYDQLTGLPNRALLSELTRNAIKRADRQQAGVATLLLDLDRFKEVNDTISHEIGDELLRHVARVLEEVVREHDVVARLGGDEFVVIVDAVTDTKDVVALAERIVSVIEEPVMFADERIETSTSIGIAMYPDDGGDPSDLLRSADLAMHQAKMSRTDRYRFFLDSMQEQARSRVALESALKRAIDKDEYELVYQPQICLLTGSILGVEALLRWWSPSRGLLTPYHFIGALEEFGLINEVGQWVLQTACKQLKQWLDAGLPSMRVSVNVSAQQFEDADFVSNLAQVLKDTELRPELLELELTESMLMADADAAAVTLKKIRDTGVRIAIDDFGTGYSSLAYLHAFPLNVLKIDRTFVQTAAEPGRAHAISSLIIGLGRNLGLEVVGEGVETEDQCEALRQAGCDAVQGYLFARPMSVDKLVHWLRQPVNHPDSQIRMIPGTGALEEDAAEG